MPLLLLLLFYWHDCRRLLQISLIFVVGVSTGRMPFTSLDQECYVTVEKTVNVEEKYLLE